MEQALALSVAVVAAVNLAKVILMQAPFFAALDEFAKSLVLQLIALACGVFAAANADLSIFASMNHQVGVFITGLLIGGGSELIHIAGGLLGAGVQALRARASGVAVQSAHRSAWLPFV